MRILQFTVFDDIDDPDHGGKLRCYYIREALRERFEVKTMSFAWSEKDSVSDFHIKLNINNYLLNNRVDRLFRFSKGIYCTQQKYLMNEIAEAIKAFSPHILLIEHPYLWQLIKTLKESGVFREDIYIVYSSHNVEVNLRRKIYEREFDREKATAYTDYVDYLEKDLIKNANSAIAVSKEDADYVTKWSSIPVGVYPNAHTSPALLGKQEKWRNYFQESGAESNWVFVGSSHPPNIVGLYTFLQSMREKRKKEVALWVLGSSANGLQDKKEFDEKDYPFLHLMGHVTSEDIESAISVSDGILLPIWEGGGSNLKTVQALLSGKFVLSSRFAFRTFEKFMQEEGVNIAETPDELAEKFASIKPNFHYSRSREVASLCWSSVLASLADFVQENYNEDKVSN